jgi:hypothetical protein
MPITYYILNDKVSTHDNKKVLTKKASIFLTIYLNLLPNLKLIKVF